MHAELEGGTQRKKHFCDFFLLIILLQIFLFLFYFIYWSKLEQKSWNVLRYFLRIWIRHFITWKFHTLKTKKKFFYNKCWWVLWGGASVRLFNTPIKMLVLFLVNMSHGESIIYGLKWDFHSISLLFSILFILSQIACLRLWRERLLSIQHWFFAFVLKWLHIVLIWWRHIDL